MIFNYNPNTYERDVKGAYKTGCFEIALNCEFHANLESMRIADLGTFLHEYVHFLQNISTPWGIYAGIVRNNDLCEMVHSMEPLDEIRLPYKFEPSQEQSLHRQWFQCSAGTGHLPIRVDRSKDSAFCYRDIEGFPIAMHEVVFTVNDKMNTKVDIIIGATIIKESMAVMYQSLIDSDCITKHPDIPYNVIQIWCEKHYPNIAGDTKKLICLCYVSLFSLDPGFSLMLLLREANLHPEKNGIEFFNDFLRKYLIMGGKKIKVSVFFNDLIEQYKLSLRRALPCDLEYIGLLLDRVKLEKGVVPILNVLNTENFGVENIRSLISYLGLPFMHQVDGKQFYTLVDGRQHSFRDVIVIAGNAAMYDYFINPYQNYGQCPFRYMCERDEAECWDTPWTQKECIFEVGIESLKLKGKKFVKD
jgi:hypothetical protein